ncbi:hypothetical protein KC319_g5003, partial [Hortaea werneckii]
AGGAGGENFEFGVDPNMDPELALVLRMSMEEERERQAREERQKAEAEGKTPLESVPEEAGKSSGSGEGGSVQVDGNGEPVGSATQQTGMETEVRREEDKKKEQDGKDGMDTQ